VQEENPAAGIAVDGREENLGLRAYGSALQRRIGSAGESFVPFEGGDVDDVWS
jgi:hypothetical protein